MPTLKDLAERIHREVDAADVIGRHVDLHQKGARLVGLCPFHDDHRPSMYVDPDKGLFHCFVCKAGGDVINFVQRVEGVDFKGALELIAQQAGIPFEMYRGVPRAQAEEGRRREETLLEAAQAARDFFRRCLDAKEHQGRGRAYLDERGIAPDIAEKLEIGCAPQGWEGLLSHLRGKGFRPQTAVEAGLAIHHQERDSFYDRFRDRLIFPIWDPLGRPVAFGGRVLAGADENAPKYINSPETPIYTKGNILYAYHLAKEAIRERGRAVLCEGYMDVVAAHSAGIPEAVASLGTALTEAQAKLIARHAKRVVFLYDADAAGQQATLRGCEVLIRNGLRVSVAPLPPGLDPDDLTREQGTEALRLLVDEAVPALRHLTSWLLSIPEGPKEPLERRIWALEQLLPCLQANPSEISRDAELGEVAQWLGLAEDLVRREVGRVGSRSARDLRREVQERKLDRPPVREQALVRCLLERPDLRDRVAQRREVFAWLTDARVRQWIERLLAAEEVPLDAGGRFALSAVEWLAADEAEAMTLREALILEDGYEDPERRFTDTLAYLEQDAVSRNLRAASKRHAEAADRETADQTSRELERVFREERFPGHGRRYHGPGRAKR